MCKIPKLDPLSEEVKIFIHSQSYLSCSKSRLLTVIKKNNSESATLHIRNEMKLHYGSNFTCCYSYVTRNGSEDEPDVGIE